MRLARAGFLRYATYHQAFAGLGTAALSDEFQLPGAHLCPSAPDPARQHDVRA